MPRAAPTTVLGGDVPSLRYTTSRESPTVAALAPRYGSYIDGGVSVDGPTTAIVNPADESVLTDVAIAAVADVDRAVRVAKGVFDRTWGALAGYERAKYLFRLFRLVGEHSRSLAVLESLNCGRPIRQTRAEVSQVGAYLFHYAGWADKLPYAGLGPRPRPLGVVGQVVSWKAPLLALARTVAPALARGNTVVLASAETTPLSALRFADLCHHAGLPPGVVNVVTGGAEAKAALVTHPRVDKVAVVGPAEVNAAAAAAGLNVPLGGAVTIVFDDAPFDQAVEGIVDTAFRGVDHGWSGAPLLVQESLHPELVTALRRRMARLRVGDPLDLHTDVGAVHSAAPRTRLQQLVTAAQAEHARPWSPPYDLPDRGYWFPPTIVTDVSAAHQIAREDLPGPLLPILTFRTPAEAAELADQLRPGQSAIIWGEKGSRTLAIADRLRAEVVWANSHPRLDPAAPAPGVPGRSPAGGRHGVEAYLA